LRRDLPVVGVLGGSPAERLLRFVHARLGLPGLAGVVDPAPLTILSRP
jgi:nitrous oxidase accessory protein